MDFHDELNEIRRRAGLQEQSRPMQNVGYHATSKSNLSSMQSKGIKPRGDYPGQWSSGPFGGNPSNPDLIYLFKTRGGAEQYAREKFGDKGTVIKVPYDLSDIVPDEDAVFELLVSRNKSIWSLFDKFHGGKGEQVFSSLEDVSDSELAHQMKEFAEWISNTLSPEQLQQLVRRHETIAIRVS